MKRTVIAVLTMLFLLPCICQAKPKAKTSAKQRASIGEDLARVYERQAHPKKYKITYEHNLEYTKGDKQLARVMAKADIWIMEGMMAYHASQVQFRTKDDKPGSSMYNVYVVQWCGPLIEIYDKYGNDITPSERLECYFTDAKTGKVHWGGRTSRD